MIAIGNKVNLGSRISQLVPWALIALVLSLPVWLAPNSISIRDFGTSDILQLLTALTTIALFLERALEVFITTTRDGQACQLEVAVKAAESEVNVAGVGEKATTQQALKNAQAAQAQYKTQTKQIALWVGLIFGLLVSAAGVRTLETLVATNALEEVPEAQVFVFHAVDILLTGGLIAGGADGLHKLANVYTNFMDTSANRAAGKPAGAP